MDGEPRLRRGLVAAGVVLISAAIRLAATILSDYGEDA